MHRSRAPNCPFVRPTVTQGGVAETAIDGEEDMVGLNSDVEDDELLEEHNGSCGVSKKKMGILQPSISSYLRPSSVSCL